MKKSTHAPRIAGATALADKKRITSTLFLASVIAVGTAGCSGGTSGSADIGWQEPAWMAEQRRQVEQYDLAMSSCFDEMGVPWARGHGGGTGVSMTGDPGMLDSPEVQQLVHDALMECFERAGGLPPMWELPPDEQTYSMLLDTIECIEVHGYSVSEPPTLEVWVEQVHPWNPFEELMTSVPEDDFVELLEICPQVGPGRIDFRPS